MISRAAFTLAFAHTAHAFHLGSAPLMRGACRGLRSGAVVRMADDEFTYTPKTVFMFPGQGAQAIGMGVEAAAELPEVKALYDKASEILGYDLLAKCANGPKEELDTTVISQPAIFVASMAAVEKFRATEEGKAAIEAADVACGLSLGEYTALAFAGAISFEDGVKITKARGEAMQAASEAASSGMASVIGLDAAAVAALCAAAAEATGEKVQIANFLCNGNYACSGSKVAVAKVVEIAKPEFKARMAVPLAVAGAFHTDFMAPAVPELEKVLARVGVVARLHAWRCPQAKGNSRRSSRRVAPHVSLAPLFLAAQVLAEVTISKPRIPVISNVDAKTHSDPEVMPARSKRPSWRCHGRPFGLGRLHRKA